MAKRCPKYTVAAGRQIYKDGEPFISVGREGGTRPVDADSTARKIARLLNQQCKRPSKK